MATLKIKDTFGDTLEVESLPGLGVVQMGVTIRSGSLGFVELDLTQVARLCEELSNFMQTQLDKADSNGGGIQ